DFNHALRQLQLDVERRIAFPGERQEIRRGAGEIAVTAIDQLKLQFHAECQRRRRLEFEPVAHRAVPLVRSPARRRASSVSTGPRIAMSRTTAPPTSAARRSSGCRATLAMSVRARLDKGARATPTSAPLARLNAAS